jgi:hypothetical protein
MKQALEALEWGQPIIEDYGSKEQLQAHLSAKDALYKAIEADMYRNPDTGNPCEGWDTSDMAHRSGGLSVEQAEKQEPVAWISEPMVAAVRRANPEWYGKWQAELTCTQMFPHQIPLYTAPPKREIEQEPVAWMTNSEQDVTAEFLFSHVQTPMHNIPLYETPPKRKWVCKKCGEKNAPVFYCNVCDYSTVRSRDFNRHLLTPYHQKRNFKNAPQKMLEIKSDEESEDLVCKEIIESEEEIMIRKQMELKVQLPSAIALNAMPL